MIALPSLIIPFFVLGFLLVDHPLLFCLLPGSIRLLLGTLILDHLVLVRPTLSLVGLLPRLLGFGSSGLSRLLCSTLRFVGMPLKSQVGLDVAAPVLIGRALPVDHGILGRLLPPPAGGLGRRVGR